MASKRDRAFRKKPMDAVRATHEHHAIAHHH
jgi:hypothetical protein